MREKFNYLKLYLNKYSIQEHSDIIKMLATIGLSYMLIELKSSSFDNLKLTFEKSQRSISTYRQKKSTQNNNNNNNRPVSAPPVVIKPTLDMKINNKIEIQNKQKLNRFSRADVISHYPFMDEFGGVDEIFSGSNNNEIISAVNLDELNLRHFITKVFNEFKIGPRGMRSSDIPSALMMLNLSGHKINSNNWIEKKIISFDQWNQIVRNSIQSIKHSNENTNFTENLEFIHSYTDDDNNNNNNNTNNNNQQNFDQFEWENDLNDNQFEEYSSTFNNHQNFHNKSNNKEKRNNIQSKSENDLTSSIPNSNINTIFNSNINQNSRSTIRSKSNPPRQRISHREDILADKLHWKRIQSKQNNAALSTIANVKLNEYLQSPLSNFNSESNFHSNSNSNSNSNFNSNVNIQSNKKIKTKNSQYLTSSSGSSSIDIANAFLKSNLGQELIQQQGDIESFQLNKEEKNYESKKFKQNHNNIDNNNNIDNDNNNNDNNNNEQKKISTAKDFYKFYADGWESKKGGWVADFGPNHTHPLSIRQNSFEERFNF